MTYSLITYPHDTLRKKAEPVNKFDKELENLLADMTEIMNRKNGLGIAAPQVNASKRCFLIYYEEQVYTFVNPKIISFSKETEFYEEGCLSIPGVFANVERPIAINIEAQNEKGEKLTLELDGIFARVFQHEYDHIEGVLFIDHLKQGMKKRIIKAYEKLQETADKKNITENTTEKSSEKASKKSSSTHTK